MRKLHSISVATLSLVTMLAACQKAEDAASVTPPPTVTLAVSPAVVKVGENATLTWTATNATSCSASGAWNGTQAISGSQVVTPTSAGTNGYTLICTGASGNAAGSASLTAEAAPVVHHESSSRPRERVASCVDCGKVTAITPVRQEGEAGGMGAVAGAVLGAVIGHQFGSGRGNSAATAGGAVAGGYGGYEAEKAIRAKTVYQITVAMDSGGTRKLTLATQEGLSVGSRVRVQGNDLEPLNN